MMNTVCYKCGGGDNISYINKRWVCDMCLSSPTMEEAIVEPQKPAPVSEEEAVVTFIDDFEE
jgi:hypothetical protein